MSKENKKRQNNILVESDEEDDKSIDNKHIEKLKKRKVTCWACLCEEPILNQLAHCDPGGCMYEYSSSDNNSSDNEKEDDKDEETCWGCLNDEPNQEAHQMEGGCEYVDHINQTK